MANEIPDSVLEQMSEKDLAHIAKSKSVDAALEGLSEDALTKIASYKPPKKDEGPGVLKDTQTLYEKNILFGARPFVAGVGSGIGTAIGELGRTDEGRGLLENIKSMPEAFGKGFSQGRGDARIDEAEAEARNPKLAAGMAIGTALGTAPLFALKGLQAAKAAGAAAKSAPLFQGAGLVAKTGNAINQGARVVMAGAPRAAATGAFFGATNALGQADSAAEAVDTIGKGAALGLATQMGANTIAATAPAIIKATGAGLKKTASALTGISEKEIQTYATRANEVKDLIKKSGGEISEAADQVRLSVTKQIQGARQKLSGQISSALKDPRAAAASVDGAPIIKKLEESLAGLNNRTSQFKSDEINQLKNVIDLTKKSLDSGGKLDLVTLNSLKQELQDIATPSYMNGATIFARGNLAAKAAKGAAGEARRLLNEAARAAGLDGIEAANNQLAKLHNIESLMNKNLIRAGKPESALLAAGSGGNPRNAKILGALDEVTGGNAVQQAENLAAARTFGNTQLLPVDTTGKAAARMIAAGAGGTAIGGPALGLAMTAATSPASLKLALDVGRLTSAIAGRSAKSIGNALVGQTARTTAINQGVENAVENPAISGAIGRRMERLRQSPPAKKPQSK